MYSKNRQNDTLTKTISFIKELFAGEGSGHDWWHIYRVKNMALKLSDAEGGNRFITEMAALLHDLDDWKLVKDNDSSKAKNWLKSQQVNDAEAKQILTIIKQVSFKGAGVKNCAESIEAKIVQDADRLDAIGAVGIARTFAYGGHKNRLIYHPEIKAEMHHTFEAYKKSTTPTINHFYEKLLLLKDRLNTETARKLAIKRHLFMETFLEQFFNEWDAVW